MPKSWRCKSLKLLRIYLGVGVTIQAVCSCLLSVLEQEGLGVGWRDCLADSSPLLTSKGSQTQLRVGRDLLGGNNVDGNHQTGGYIHFAVTIYLSSRVVKWVTTTARCLGVMVPALPWWGTLLVHGRHNYFAAIGEQGKHFSLLFHSLIFLSIKWWAAKVVAKQEGACICTHRGSPAVSLGQCHIMPELCLCWSTQNQEWASSMSNVAVFILEDPSYYAAAISVSTVLDIWVLWQIMSYLHEVFVWQCEHRYPFSLRVLLCSHATDTHECFMWALLCSVFCSVFSSFWKWLNPLYINISFMFLT